MYLACHLAMSRAATRSRLHVLVALLLLSTAVCAFLLFIAAAHRYPGGTHFDHLRPGHDFWRNTICDVARSKALGGARNHGATLARGAMGCASLGLGALFWLLSERFPSRQRLSVIVRGLGALVIPGGIAVALLPTDHFSVEHGIAIVITGIPGLLAAILATYALVFDEARSFLIASLGVLAVAVSTADFAIYVHELVVGGGPRIVVAVLERVASLLLVAWMIAVAATSLRRNTKAASTPRPGFEPEASIRPSSPGRDHRHDWRA